jgi:hypothetical protein
MLQQTRLAKVYHLGEVGFVVEQDWLHGWYAYLFVAFFGLVPIIASLVVDELHKRPDVDSMRGEPVLAMKLLVSAYWGAGNTIFNDC